MIQHLYNKKRVMYDCSESIQKTLDKKEKSRLYSQKQYYKKKLLDILRHDIHVERFDKYMLKLEQSLKQLGYTNITLDTMFPDENIKDDDIHEFKKRNNKVIRDIFYYSQELCTHNYIPNNVKQLFLFITYICKKRRFLFSHTPKSASQGILYFCYDYLQVPYKHSSYIDVSITTIRKITKYLYSIEKDIIPSQYLQKDI